MSGLLTAQVLIATFTTVIVMAIQIASYAARYAGVLTRRIATAISLFSLLVTASRLAALLITPSLGAIADGVAKPASDAHLTSVPAALLGTFDTQMRIIVAANTLGVLLGIVLLPVFLRAFVRGIGSFERLGSIPRALLRLGDPRVIADLAGALTASPGPIGAYRRSAIPMKLIIANTVLYTVYSIGVVAAYYASVLDLTARTTATGLSGIVNGVGTVAFALFIDPATAFIVDQTVRGERTAHDVKSMIFWLCITALVGTVLAQLILFPAAEYIAAVAHFWAHQKH